MYSRSPASGHNPGVSAPFHCLLRDNFNYIRRFAKLPEKNGAVPFSPPVLTDLDIQAQKYIWYYWRLMVGSKQSHWQLPETLEHYLDHQEL